MNYNDDRGQYAHALWYFLCFVNWNQKQYWKNGMCLCHPTISLAGLYDRRSDPQD